MNKRICLNKSVLDFMANVLKQHDQPTVLEFGSGWSSAWLATRCTRLVTVETNAEWAVRVAEDLTQAGFTNWQLVRGALPPEEYMDDVVGSMRDHGLKGECVDLILIDCHASLRHAASILAWCFLQKGGWILFDDAQRKQHQADVAWLTAAGGKPTRLKWQHGDVGPAKQRLTLAWRKK